MADKVCTQCGYVGSQKKRAHGSFFMECCVWFLGLICCAFFGFFGAIVLFFALLYSLWRLVAGSDKICPSCQNKDCMIPVTSPRGQELLAQRKKAK